MEADVKLLFGVLGGGSVSDGSGKEIAKDIARIVYQLEKSSVTKIKFSPDKDSANKMRSTIQSYIDEGNRKKQFVVKVSKIDTSQALKGLKTDLEKVVKSISIKNGVDIKVNTKAFGEIASDAGTVKTNVDQASKVISQFSAQMRVLDATQKSTSKAFEAVLNNASNISSKSGIAKLRAEYQALMAKIEEIRQSKRVISDEEMADIDRQRAAIERKTRKYLEAAEQEKQAAKGAGKAKRDAAKEAERAEKRAADEREKAAKKEQSDLTRAIDLYNQIEKYKKKNSRIDGTSFGHSLDGISAQLKQVIDGHRSINSIDISRLTRQWKILRGEIETTGAGGKSILTILKEGYAKFGGWTLITRSMRMALRTFRQMFSAIVDIDTAMTELRKVTSETEKVYDSFLSNAAIQAKKIGATVVDTVSATADFARLGYGIEEASSLANAALIYKNVGDGIDDINDASEPLIASMKAFGIAADDAMLIVDKFNVTGNNFAITSGGVGDALLNSAAALNAAGNSIDESIALITAANNVVQDPEKVGTTLKTVSMYLRAAKTEAEDAGESTDGMANSVSELRKEILALTGGKVDIQVDDNTFKNTYQILKELSVVWGDLTDVSQANLLEMLGGKRNSNVVSALLNDFSTAEAVIQKTSNAAGSAIEENEKYLESINGRVSKLKASFETLSTSIINSDMIKWAVDGGNLIVEILDKIVNSVGALPALLSATGAALSAMNVKSILSSQRVAYIPDTGLIGASFRRQSQKNIDASALSNLATSLNGLEVNSESATAALETFGNTASSTAKQFANHYIVQVADANDSTKMIYDSSMLSSMGMQTLSKSLVKFKVGAIAAKAATIALNSALSFGIGIALNFAIQQIDKWIRKNREAADAALEAAQNYDTASATLSDYATEIGSLKEKLRSETLSHEESYDARRRLLEIQGEIAKAYGLEAGQLDLLTMSADEATAALNKVNAAMADEYLTKNADIIEKAVKAVEAEDNYLSKSWNVTPEIASDSAFIIKEIEKIFSKYEAATLKSFTDSQNGNTLYTLNIDASAYEAKETINGIAKDIRELDAELAKSGQSVNDIFSKGETFSKFFQEGIANVDHILEKNDYGQVYEKATQMKIAADSQYHEVMLSVLEAQEAYNDALANTYDSEEARNNAIDTALEKYQEVAAMVANPEIMRGDLGVQRYFEDLLAGLAAAAKKHSAQSVLEDVFSEYLTEKQSADGRKKGDSVDSTDALTRAREKFITVAREAGMTEEEIALTLKDSELYFKQYTDSIVNGTNQILSLTGALNSLASMQGEVDKLSEALGEFYESNKISAETAAGLTETFGTLQGFDDFISTITNSSSTFSDVQSALNTLGAQYVESTGILSNLNDENKESIKFFLKQMGVVNADEVVMAHLANNQVKAAVASGKLADETWDTTEEFLKQTGASAALIESLKNLRFAEYEATLQSVDFSEASEKTFNKLIEMAGAAGLAAKNITILKKAQDLADRKDLGLLTKQEERHFDSLMAGIQKQVSTGANTKFTVDINIDIPDGSDTSGKVEDYMSKLEEEYNKVIANFEHNIFLGEKNGADYNALIAIYKKMQDAAHAQAEKYRAMGLSENSEYIQALQKQWWDYQESIEQLREDHFNDYLTDSKFAIDILKAGDNEAAEIINSWKNILSSIESEISYYRSIGYDDTSDVIQKLLNEVWSAKEEISTAIQEVVDEANETLDGFQDVYSTITDAAKEYASTGYLSVDSLQAILDLGPQYLAFLEDENGQLVLNEKSLQNVIAAKTEEMAVETALAYVRQALAAIEQDDIQTLNKLTGATLENTNANWDQVYSLLGLVRVIGEAKGIQSSYFDTLLSNVNKIRSLSKTAVSSIQAYYRTLDDEYISHADALQTVLEMTQEMIQWENDQKIEALEKEVELLGDIVDKRKESLQIEKEQADHNKSVAEKLEKIAKLQSQIDLLKLDDSREALAERRKLEEEMNELQKSLTDEQADYSLDIQLDALDKQQEAFEESKEDEIKALEETLDSAEELYQAAIKRIEADWDDLYADLLSWNANYGSTLEKDLVNAWDAATAAVQRYGSFVAALEGVQDYTNLGAGMDLNTGSEISGGVADIVSQMKKNSLDWFTADSSSAQSAISANQADLALQYQQLTGETLTSKNGSWYRPDGSSLYTLDKNTVARTVVGEMKANSAAWHDASSSERSYLETQNNMLAARLANYLGKSITKNAAGQWLMDGKLLYDIYHSGGVVGGSGSLKKNEVMAILEKGELVLDEGREKTLYRLIDFTQHLSDKLGKMLNMDALKSLVSRQNQVLPTVAAETLSGTRNEVSINPIVNINIEHSGSFNDDDARRFASIAAESTLSELTSAFTRRGITNIGNAILK